ncbi:uncharacterized protein LOC122505781 isoform X2 [Leptopilina heterotoma]|uniref:uncharacterized protein LOC122505781 isoform X2 n=1 Tax=Leptopilina heterotoma TaxID=63436 RepID=UPI001CA8B44F|nr:uncharacterized protein LOC122505781 isoform X2 [Leptopilina heterotoma]
MSGWEEEFVERVVIRQIFIHIYEDYETLQVDAKELEILLKYSKMTKIVIISYIVYTTSTMFAYVIIGQIPYYMDLINPLNETRPRYYPAEVNYVLFEEDNYYLAVTTHELFGVVYGVNLIVLSDLILFLCSRHTCALFGVLKYKILSINKNKDGEFLDVDDPVMYENACACAKLHIRILAFIELTNSCFAMALLLLFSTTVMIMSFHLSMIILKQQDFNYFVKGVSIAIGQAIHIFFNCFTGQMVQSQSSNLTSHLYDFHWYDTKKKIAMVIYYMTSRSLIECNLNVGKTLVLGLDLYTTIMKTIFSYLNVLNSRHNAN